MLQLISPRNLFRLLSACFFLPFSLYAASTATSLTVTPGSAAAGDVITLTASVSSGNAPVSPGLVVFCDASFPHCTDIHILGQAQLTSAGVASIKLRKPIGTYSIRADFQGTKADSVSSSSTQSLTVTGQLKTSISICNTGSTFHGWVTTYGLIPTTGGTVDFLDASDENSQFASATAGAETWRNLSFHLLPFIDVGNAPAGDVLGDFNNDGIPDIAETDTSSGTISILLGKGDGTFTRSTVYTGAPAAMAVGDFNSDGIQDIAYSDTVIDSLVVLLGNGDGTFKRISKVTPLGGPNNVANTADFNHDGIADIVVVGQNGSTTVLLGKGDGTFATSAVIQLSNIYAQGLTVGDLNGDGIPDIAASTWDSSVHILISNGDGTFSVKPTLGAGSIPVGMAIADFNGDGILDLVVGNAYSQNASVYIGRGDGTFQNQVLLPTGNHPNDVAVGDFNGDGIADITSVNSFEDTASVFLGKGDGTFKVLPNVATGGGPFQVVAADLNADGAWDIATPNTYDTTFTILLSNITLTNEAVATGVTVPGTGTRQVFASYLGDAEHTPSQSHLWNVPGTGSDTATTLAVSQPLDAATLQFTANVSPKNTGNHPPTGQVVFHTNTHVFGVGTISNGQAAISSTSMPSGSYWIRADYQGDTNFVGSYSKEFWLTVK